LLLLVAPVFLLIAALNQLLTRRVLFRQTRLGLGLQPFVLLKFQTMVDGADRESSVTVHGDARTTPLGRVLRALKLDELPQLINVVRGEMTLVGPRPLTPNEIAAVPRPLAEAVYRRPPGLTGISAIAFVDEERVLARAADPYRAYFEEVLPRKLALELAYVQRRTWLTDLVILVTTPLAPFVPALRRVLLARLTPEWAGLAGAQMTGSGAPGPRARVEVRR
jgi:lipopolysaccharide/colanic/teichoic acid biosynthesis glycosyltransferase